MFSFFFFPFRLNDFDFVAKKCFRKGLVDGNIIETSYLLDLASLKLAECWKYGSTSECGYKESTLLIEEPSERWFIREKKLSDLRGFFREVFTAIFLVDTINKYGALNF